MKQRTEKKTKPKSAEYKKETPVVKEKRTPPVVQDKKSQVQEPEKKEEPSKAVEHNHEPLKQTFHVGMLLMGCGSDHELNSNLAEKKQDGNIE